MVRPPEARDAGAPYFFVGLPTSLAVMTPDAPVVVPRETFLARRRRVLERLGGGVMVLPAAAIQHASRDTERPYVADRELYYLTGLTEPESVAVLVGGDEPRLELFVRERDPKAELWAGPRLGPDGAEELVGPDACHPLGELQTELPGLLAQGDRIHYRMGRGGVVEHLVLSALHSGRTRGPRTGDGPRGVVDPGEVLDDLRLVKDEVELGAIRRACRITVEGHRVGASVIEPGVGEWVVEAAVEAAFRGRGATGPGFATIVGSGPNACVLHYVGNGDVVGEDALVLVDAGAESALYHGDVTRTYPASGSFTGPQRDVYVLVDAARDAAIEATRPGTTIGAVHDACLRVLVDGLVDLGVLEGEVDGLLEREAYKTFFPHQTSHWLGLDVHDPGDYTRDGASRELEAGMVFTVEPGLYFRPGQEEGAAGHFEGIGIRIEDDVAVTADGHEVLTSSLPTAADDVETLVGA